MMLFFSYFLQCIHIELFANCCVFALLQEAQEKAKEEEKEEEKGPTSEDEPAVAPRKRKVSTKQEKAPKPKTTTSTKRSTPEDSPALKKRRKTQKVIESEESAVSSPSDDEEDDEDEVRKPTKRVSTPLEKSPNKKPKPELPAEDASEESDIANKGQAQESSTSQTRDDQQASESELSVVLDEEPKPKRKRQKSTDAPAKKGKKRTTAKADPKLDPDQAEIKRLQGWLIKCGIRKMWFRELAPYDTPKAKIKHLKKMLEDAGMKGRYSVEKARQIREERELQEDLTMVQEGARRWGTGSADEESDNDEKPRRRLARGLKTLAFLGDDDGEETD
jgi:hypothetical protein